MAMLILPMWPAQPWFHELRSLVMEPPAIICNLTAAYMVGLSGCVEPLRNPKWRIAVWCISGAQELWDGVMWPVGWWKKDCYVTPQMPGTLSPYAAWQYGALPRGGAYPSMARWMMWPQWLTMLKKLFEALAF